MNCSKTIASVATLGALCFSTGESSASLKFHNNTRNTIFTIDAFAATSGVGCGFDDGCKGTESGSFPPGFRVVGWFQIAPGGTATVESHAFHNAKHQGFAQDTLGNVWAGGAQDFCISNDPQNHCGGACPNSFQTSFPVFFSISRTTCCGFWCSPVNFTIDFNL